MASDLTARLGGARSTLAYKAPCRVGAVSNISLTGTQTIDGVAVVAEDRVLVMGQTNQAENGIWLCKPTGWTRAKDFDGTGDVVTGTRVAVHSGTDAVKGAWVLTTADPITIGSSNIVFETALAEDYVGVYAQGGTDVAVVDGGTGASTAIAGFDNLSPTTTRGDLIARGAAVNERLPVGNSGYALISDGTDPAWTGFVQSGTGAATRTWQSKARDLVFVEDFGAVGDGVKANLTLSITSGLTALTATGGSFSAGDVGKLIVVPGAGAAGVPLATTIAAVGGATTITLADAAATTLAASAQRVTYGTDNTTAIQNAINSLPVYGGKVRLGAGLYCTTGLYVGDGTSSALSTRWGVSIEGVSPPPISRDSVQWLQSPSALAYCGDIGVSGSVLVFWGPLSGFAARNIHLDGCGLADYCLRLQSVGNGVTEFLSFEGWRVRGYSLDCYSTSGYGAGISVNTEMITGGNLFFLMPAVANAVSMAFYGPSDGTSSSNFTDLHVIRIYPSSAVAQYPVVFQVADSVTLRNILVFHGATAHASTFNVLYDYTANATFPSNCLLDMVDVGWNTPIAQQYGASGTPGSSATPNQITNLVEINGGTHPLGLANVNLDLPKLTAGTLALSAQTAAIPATTFYTARNAGLYRINYYIKTTQAGSAGTATLQLGWFDPVATGVNATAINATVLDNQTSGTVVAYCDDDTVIQYVVVFAGVTGSFEYRLTASVERLC